MYAILSYRRWPVTNQFLAVCLRRKRSCTFWIIETEKAYLDRDPYVVAVVENLGIRTNLCVPMLKGVELVGAISIYHRDVRPFTDKQIDLLKNFAAQAVIAIENARLLNELRESLRQQTATSHVLKAISRSTFDLQPILDTLVETAALLCQADMGLIANRDGDVYCGVASFAYSPEYAAFWRNLRLKPSRATITGRAALERRLVHITDVTADPEYEFPESVAVGKNRTLLGVPLLRDGEPIGVISFGRHRVEPFTEQQIELVRTFADQAVIAIENTRLLNECLRESLQQQTATADVLKVISRSTFDLQVVLDTLVESAARLCEAEMAAAHRLKGDVYEHAASFGLTPELHEHFKTIKFEPGRGSVTGRTVLEGNVVHIHDVRNDPEYTLTAAVEMLGARTTLGVPLLREGIPIGVFVLMRRTVRPFTEKQIELLSTFADQAVIAIENVRLFEAVQQRTRELSEALEQQTATAEVLGVISRSKFELQPILQSVVETAERLCRAEQTVIYRLEDGAYRFAAGHSSVPEYLEVEKQTTIVPGHGTVVGRAALTRQVARIDDAWSDPLYEKKDEARLGGVRSMIGVPLMREGEPIGAIALARNRVEPFVEREIELVTTFADQAVIAIENARLLNELRQRTADLTESLEQQTATSEVLSVISSSPGDLQPVFESVLANATRLCEANFADPEPQRTRRVPGRRDIQCTACLRRAQAARTDGPPRSQSSAGACRRNEAGTAHRRHESGAGLPRWRSIICLVPRPHWRANAAYRATAPGERSRRYN